VLGRMRAEGMCFAALALAIAILCACLPLQLTCVIIFVAFAVFRPRRIHALHEQVIIRSHLADGGRLEQGSSFWIFFPEYVVEDNAQFGPWCKLGKLPVPGQLLDIDLPPSIVSVENGTYQLKVNTKVKGRVTEYTLADLSKHPIPLHEALHDSITTALREGVHEMPLEEAIGEINKFFETSAERNEALVSGVACFAPTRLMLDANERITHANSATADALELVAQRKKQVATRAMQEERHKTAMREQAQRLELTLECERQQEMAKRALQEERHLSAMKLLEDELKQKAEQRKVHAIEMQMRADELKLTKEAYGAEGAAQVEAAKHAKASYLFTGGAQGSTTWTSVQVPPP